MKALRNLEVGDYISILWRWRWYGIITAFVVTSIGLLYAWKMPKIYRSVTSIKVETPIVSEDYDRNVGRVSPEDRIKSIREQVASRTFLERMIVQFKMADYGARSDFIMEDAVRAIRKRILIERTSDDTFTLSFAATDPVFAQMVTRRLADELIRISYTSRKDKVMAADQFIDEQLRQAAETLSTQEQKIKDFKTRHLGELPEQSNANLNALGGLRTQLSATESALQQARDREKLLEFRIQERDRIGRLSRSMTGSPSPKKVTRRDEVPTQAENELKTKKSLLADLRAKYTPKHPDVVRTAQEVKELELQVAEQKSAAAETLSAESEDVPSSTARASADSEIAAATESAELQMEAQSIKKEIDKRERERVEILEQIKVYQSRLNLAPALEQELSGILREADLQRQQYAALQRQKFSSQMATVVETDKKLETYKIIDPANLPVYSESPGRRNIAMAGLILGLALGLGAALGREMLDSTIGSENEVLAVLKLPILISIPDIPKQKALK